MKSDNNDQYRYDDIINLPRHRSRTRPPMSRSNRAAQFSPFAALTGYEEAVKETARLTDKPIELDETVKTKLDEKLRLIKEQLSNDPEIIITFFQPDDKKSGGSYLTIRGIIKKIDYYERAVLMKDGTRIEIDEIVDIEEV